MAPNENFWPELEPAKIVTPASILRSQAEALSKTSQGRLQAVVETWAVGQNIHHRLVIFVPALENYRYSFMRVHHSVTLYPVYADEAPGLESPVYPHYNETDGLELPDEPAFLKWLKETFQSQEAKDILGNLMAQAVP